MNPGPTKVESGSLYAFAHQAYWGFRYLSEHQGPLWRAIKTATSVSEVQKIGDICAGPNAMPNASYGAVGAMTWLARDYVANEILAARKHPKYPKSNRPTSEDRRMIFLGIAVAAGIFELRVGTALRRLAESKMGLEVLADEVHQFDRYKKMVEEKGYVIAEPITNYVLPLGNGRVYVKGDLPCYVPANHAKGYIIHGYCDGHSVATFSEELPADLANSPEAQYRGLVENAPTGSQRKATVTDSPNQVICHCGAIVAARDRETALKVLADHKRAIHSNSDDESNETK